MQISLSIYLLPPALSLISGIFLAALSLTRPGGTKEKTSFAMVCLWYSLLPAMFILHHAIHDTRQMLVIERMVHFVYVYLPVVQAVFFHHVLHIRRNSVVYILLVVSFLISLTTFGDAYFSELQLFSWGYIAKGGIAFFIFGGYCAATLVYCVYCCLDRLKAESNPRLRLKFIYIGASFGMMAFLTFLNIPAIQGKNIYPAGNFIFLPMAVLAYGVLKHRLLVVRSLLHIVLTRLLIFALVVIPNAWLFDRIAPVAMAMSPMVHFAILAFWFGCNYIYVSVVRIGLSRWLYPERYHLMKAEAHLLREIMILRSTDDLSRRLKNTIRNVLPYPWARVYVYDEKNHRIANSEAGLVDLAESAALTLAGSRRLIERHALPLQPQLIDRHAMYLQLMTDLGADIMVPLVHNRTFIGLLTLPSKSNGQPVTPDEAEFIEKISHSLALALYNAVMYQRISALKDSLQIKTDALIQENNDRLRAEQRLRTLQEELQGANLALERAILQANEMTARLEITNHELIKEMEDRRRTEEALRQSEETYRLIAENSTDVIWTIDLEGWFTFISPSVEHLLGYTPGEMLTLTIAAVLTTEAMQTATQVIAEEMVRARNHEGPNVMSRATQLEQVRKDGSTVWTESNTRFITDGNRNFIGILGVTRDITERKKTEQELIHLAYFDALTGLCNRKAFIEFLEDEIKYAQRYQSGLALLFFDLNKFKLVNDTFGHEVGDKLLKTVADRVKGVVRETDLVGRLGGDEFTIILKNPEEISPDIIARRIVDGLADPFDFEDTRVDYLSASIGIASYPKDGLSAGELMKHADMAMYEAKKRSIDWMHFTQPAPGISGFKG